MFFAAAFVSCSSSSNEGGTISVSLQESQVSDDLSVGEISSFDENTICVSVNWAKPTDVFGIHSRNVKLAAKVGEDWRLLWEKDENGSLDEAGVSAPISLSDEDASWLFRAEKIILSATQTDPLEGSDEQRILVSSRDLLEDQDGDTPALNIAKGADLTDAMLAGAELSGLDLSGTSFPGADLQCADLSYADLTGAGLAGADLSVADLSGATWLDGSQCLDPSPDGCDLPKPQSSPSKERGTFVTITNNDNSALRCKQDCSAGSHNPCEADVPSGQSKTFYGFYSWVEDIVMTCEPINSTYPKFYVYANQPSLGLTSYIRILIAPDFKEHRLVT
jgi:hypothetical protein